MPNINANLSDSNFKVLSKISNALSNGTINGGLNALLDGVQSINHKGEQLSILQIMNAPDMNLKILDTYENHSIRSDFKSSFDNLRFSEKIRIYQILHLLTYSGRSEKSHHILRYNECCISTGKNLNLYYVDKSNYYKLNFYLNLTGVTHNVPIYDFTTSVRKANDTTSTVFISSEERFISSRLYYSQEDPLFDKIKKWLNTGNYSILQLDSDDLDIIIQKIKQEI